MGAYILKRILLMIPTLLGIMLMTFAVIQFVPGGPIEQVIAQIQGTDVDATARIGGSDRQRGGRRPAIQARTASGVGTLQIPRRPGARSRNSSRTLEKQFGFDKPVHERFFLMMQQLSDLQFRRELFPRPPVVDLIIEKMPVSISLGLWLTLITYLVSIPLGIRKAVQRRQQFRRLDLGRHHRRLCHSELHPRHPADRAVRRRQLFQLVSAARPHLRQFRATEPGSARSPTMPGIWRCRCFAMGIGGFATMTLLTKNSFLDEIRKQYVMTARAKGLSERRCSMAMCSAMPCCW